MKSFFNFFFASCLGCFISSMLVIFVLIGIFSSISFSDTEQTVTIENNSVLYINLDAPIYDREVEDLETFSSNLLSDEIIKPIGLTEFMEVIRKAKTDENIKAIFLQMSMLQTNGWATVDEIRQVLLDFKTSGKKIYAYSDMFITQNAYYLATVADKIYLNPAGNLSLTGLGAEVMYYKDLFDKLDIDVELIRPRNNSYKSAGETYISNKMSEENREQIKAYISDIWNYVSQNIVEARKLQSVDTFNAKVSRLEYFLPKQALDNELVDSLTFKTNVEQIIVDEVKKQFSINSPSAKVNFVKYNKYRKTIPTIFKKQQNNIAVIYAYGNVNQGKGNALSIGSETLVRAIEKAAKDNSVKAIVLRVNSPGGDAIASELITNEVIKAKKRKPVIVSMGDVAASAGYEMSSNASLIVASPITITGSIGVFGIMPNIARSLKNNVGLTFDTVKTNDNAIMSLTTPRSSQSKLILQMNVENFYDNFITRVAEGRKLEKTYVDSIARGRVWSATDAKELGLVDEFGGLNKAISIAAKKAGIEQYGIVAYPKQKDILTQLLESVSEESDLQEFVKHKDVFEQLNKKIEKLSQNQGVQARIPYIINF
ncbi:MAG: signal peptide peptidase SppA [Bacteroidales bacterium]|nr:signal peptide peptidase SppA [Bacteroidales bacterium]